MRNQIVILAAGKGKRMGSDKLPKVLIQLGGRPVISHLLNEIEKLREHATPVLVVGFKHQLVEEALGKKYVYAYQREQLGTAHAVWTAKDKITASNIVVLNGDMPFIKAISIIKLMNLHKSQDAIVSMFTVRVPNFDNEFETFNHFGRIIRDTYGNIIKIKEYADASEEEQKILEVNTGEYIFNTEWLWNNIDKITANNAQTEFYLTDIIEIAIADSHTIQSLPISPYEVFGINTKDQLLAAEKLLK